MTKRTDGMPDNRETENAPQRGDGLDRRELLKIGAAGLGLEGPLVGSQARAQGGNAKVAQRPWRRSVVYCHCVWAG